MKTEAAFQGSVWLMVEFKDSGGNFLLTNYSSIVSGPQLTYTQLTMRTVPAPLGTIEATFQMRAGGSQASALFDDAVVDYVPIPEPAAVGLLGLGGLLLWGRCWSRRQV